MAKLANPRGMWSLLLMLVLSLSSCDTDNWERDRLPDDFNRVVAGERMAGAALGEPFEAIRLSLGRPEIFTPWGDPAWGFQCDYDHKGLTILVEDTDHDGNLDYSDLIAEMYAYYPYYGLTDEGIGLNTLRSHIVEVYGEPLPENRFEEDIVWLYPDRGIDFFFFNEWVLQYHIYSPETSSTRATSGLFFLP